MKKLFLGLVLVVPLAALAACSQTERGATIGGLGGAAVGGLIAGPNNTAEGALVGGAIGAVTGGLIGKSIDNENDARYDNRDRYNARDCVYYDNRGREYIARC